MNFEIIIISIMSIMTMLHAGVYQRPTVTPPQLAGTYIMTLQKVVNDQGIAPGFKVKFARDEQ